MLSGTSFANMEETYQYFKALMLKHSLSVSVCNYQAHYLDEFCFSSETTTFFTYIYTGCNEKSNGLCC